MSSNITFKNIFINDWPRKVSAIVLAILIYSIVRIQLQQERTFDHVRVKVVTDNPKLVVLDDEPVYVSVSLEGTKRSISRLKSQQIQIVHKIDAMTELGPYTFILGDKDINLPPGVQLTGATPFSPARVNVQLDRVIEKNIDVRILINRESIPNGWEEKFSKSQPRKVNVRGPRTYLDSLNYIDTEEVEIVRRLDTPKRVVQSVKLVKPSGILSMSHSTVEVNIELNKNKDFTRFNNIGVQVLNSGDPELVVTKFIDPPFISVSVKGDRNEIDFLEDSHIKAFIEIDNDVGVGETLRPIRVWLDPQNRESCTISSKTPESLRIVVGKKSESKPDKTE